MKVLKTLLLLLVLVFSIVGYSAVVLENVSITVGYKDTSLDKIRFPRMPQKYSVEPIRTSTGLIYVFFENYFTDVNILIYKEGEELLNDNYSKIASNMSLTFDLNLWGKGTYIVEITTNERGTILKQIEFD